MIMKEQLIEAGLDEEEAGLVMNSKYPGLVLTILAAFKAREEGKKDWLNVLRNPDLKLRVIKGK